MMEFSTLSIILASASPRRVHLLESLGVVLSQIIPADIDETPLHDEKPEDYALRIAIAKTQKVAAANPNQLILGADTVVAIDDQILPKADDRSTAEECLTLLSGRDHRVLTSVCLSDKTNSLHHRTVTTIVRFASLSPKMLTAYLESGEWKGKAGGYAIQGLAASFIPFISGSYSNVVGLPLFETAELLENAIKIRLVVK